MKPQSILSIFLLAPLLHAQQPAPATDREHDSSEPMITDLSIYNRDQLMTYAAGLELPDNPIRSLHPKYLELKAEIEGMKQQGYGNQHPLVVPKLKELEGVKTHMDLAFDKLKDTVQAKLNHANARMAAAQQDPGDAMVEQELDKLKAAVREQEQKVDAARKHLADLVKTKGIANPAPPAPPDGLAALEAEKRQLEAQLGALLKLRDEPLCDFAATLEVPDNVIPTLYPHYLERKKDYENVLALGLAPNHPTARGKLQQLEEIRVQLDEGIASLRDSYRVKLNLANTRLEQARAATPRAAVPPAAPPAGLRAEKARLEAQIKALSSLSGEALLIFAGNLGLAANPVPELHRRLTETTLQLVDLRAEGLADDHPEVAANNARLKALNDQLHSVIGGLKEALRAQAAVVAAQLNAEGKRQ